VRADRIRESYLVKKIFCGLDNLKELPKLVGGTADVFYHFGWDGTSGSDRQDMYKQNMNVRYALDAVEAAAKLGCKRFVGAGSQAEYGRYEGKLDGETPTSPENGYGMAKLCAGEMSRVECNALGMDHVWVRILSIYGPRDGMGSMISSTICKLLGGECPDLTEGIQKWDYLYSEDAADALYRCAVCGRNGAVYPLGSGQAMPLRAYIEAMRDAIDPALPLGFGKIPYGPLQVMHLQADISEISADAGFVPRTEFADGIRETIQWIKRN
jgi:nucleoside-diphosphate-sugar epimerase